MRNISRWLSAHKYFTYPLLLGLLTAAAELLLRIVVFNDVTSWLQVGPSLALWATGVAFALTLWKAEQYSEVINIDTLQDVEARVEELAKLSDISPSIISVIIITVLWFLSITISARGLQEEQAAAGWVGYCALSLLISFASIGIMTHLLKEAALHD